MWVRVLPGILKVMASECEGFARQSTKLKEQGSTPVEATWFVSAAESGGDGPKPIRLLIEIAIR